MPIVRKTGSGGGGGASGDATYTDTFANIPGASNVGDLFFPSDGYSVYRDTGAAWIPWGPMYPFTAPISGDFAWVNQGGAAVDTTQGGVALTAPPSGPMSIRVRTKAAPATPYTITTLIIPTYERQNYAFYHLGLRDSATGRLHHMRVGFNGADNVVAIITSSGTGADVAQQLATAAWSPSGETWMRVTDDGSDFFWYLSWDGVHWWQIYTIARTNYCANPDQIWWGADSRNKDRKSVV